MFVALAFSAALLVGAPSVAQSQSTTAPEPQKVQSPDPSALAAAERLLTAMGYEDLMRRTADAIAAQSGPSMKKAIEQETGQEVDDELVSRLQKLQRSHMESLLLQDKNLRRATALIYARHFTAAELDRIAALQADPVMRKWSDVAPALMGDMMPLVMDLMIARRPELIEQAKKVVTDYYTEKDPD